MRRLSTASAAAVLVGLIVMGTAQGAAAANRGTSAATSPAVQVVKISGLLDAILADFLDQSITAAERSDAPALILRIDSSGAVISNERLDELAERLESASIPVIAWIGPSGARVEGRTAQLLAVVDKVGIAPGGAIGNFGETVVSTDLWSPAFIEHRATLRDGVMSADAAAEAGLTVPTEDALVLRRMLLEVPGFTVDAVGSTPATPVEFSQLSTGKNLMHTFASPAVAQLLFIIGLCLILFELYTAGIGVAGLTGAFFVVFGCYGLAALPVRPVAVALIVAAMIAYAVDVQVGTPRAWTVIGSVLFTAGFVALYEGLATPWISTIGGIAGVIVFMVFGMPAMTRSRFSTPVIARDWLVGRNGEAIDTLAPDGVVRIGEGLWVGRSTGEKVPTGAAVRVIGMEGVVCRVETTTGTGDHA